MGEEAELAEQIDNAALLFVQYTLHADNVVLVQRHIVNAVNAVFELYSIQ